MIYPQMNVIDWLIISRYGMVLPPEPEILSGEEVLTAYAMIRGFMAVGGRADQSRGARVILKDFVMVLICLWPLKKIFKEIILLM